MRQAPNLSPRVHRALALSARVLLWLVLAAWVLFGVSWGLLHWVIVPRLGEMRPQLEAMATRALGVTVRVDAIRALDAGALPTIELTGVRLHDEQGREALRLQRVLGAISVASVWRLGFEQLVIDQPTLEVRRDAKGRLLVAGIALAASPEQDSTRAANWLFSQEEVLLRGGTLRWTDEWRGQPPLALVDVDIVLQNPRRTHRMRLDATPPAELGGRFSLRGDFQQPLLNVDAGDWRRWRGQWYLEFLQVDLHQLLRRADPAWLAGMDWRAGQGALRAWLDMRDGALAGASADLALRHAELALGRQTQALALDALSGRLRYALEGSRHELGTERLAFRTRDGEVWPGGNATVTWLAAAPGVTPADTPTTAFSVKADRLDLAALRRLGTHLPLPQSLRGWLDELQPAGLVETLEANWRSKADAAPESWRLKTRVAGLALAAGVLPPLPEGLDPRSFQGRFRPARAGLRGAIVSVDATQDGGQLTLDMTRGALLLPGVFEEPELPFDLLRGQANWTVKGQALEVEVPTLELANADLAGTLSARWRRADPDTSGHLKLDGELSRAAGARVHRYLPLAVHPDARQYVREAVAKGQASGVRFAADGPLDDFPYARAGSGRFTVSAALSDVELHYVPPALLDPQDTPWPALEAMTARLLIEQDRLQVQRAQGAVQNLPGLAVSAQEVLITSLDDAPVLTVQALAKGPAPQALAFVRRSPLAAMLSHALDEAQASANVEVAFGLTVPLEQIERTEVRGQVRLAGNDLRLGPDLPPFTRVSGKVDFSEQGFTVPTASARVLGGELTFQGGTRSTAGGGSEVRFKGQGSATAEGLRQATMWPALAGLGRLAEGSASYRLELGLRGGHSEWQLSSTLQGLAVKLPAPLGKAADTSLPLRVDNRLSADAQADVLAVDVGAPASPLLALRYDRDLRGAAPRLRRGSVSLQAKGAPALAWPAAGVQAVIDVPRVDVDAWGAVLSLLSTDPNGAASDYLPTLFSLQTDRLSSGGRDFHRVVFGGSRQGKVWLGNVDADELNGYLEYHDGEDGAGRVVARLAWLQIPQARTAEVERLLQQPSSVPALDVQVERFELAGRQLGRLDIAAINRRPEGDTGAPREWRLTRLNLDVPEASLRGVGNWAALGAQAPGAAPFARRTALNFKLEVRDAGRLLERFGMPGVLLGGKGSLEGSMGWLGSPMSLDTPSLNGELTLDLSQGQFLKADPGLAKLLGVLSLQALPRRLTLDFRDVFSEGFSFDFVRGHAQIASGVASTNNLQMKGVNAAVLMEGKADIVRETQDLHVLVVPEVNAGSSALIATVINPALGLGGFLAQFLLGRTLQEVGTREFQITGTWQNPSVTRLQRGAAARPTDEAPAIDGR